MKYFDINKVTNLLLLLIFRLEEHKLTIHEGVKKYQCSHCGKAFGKGFHLNKHIATVHEHKFDCKLCTKKYQCQSALDRHMANVHENAAK